MHLTWTTRCGTYLSCCDATPMNRLTRATQLKRLMNTTRQKQQNSINMTNDEFGLKYCEPISSLSWQYLTVCLTTMKLGTKHTRLLQHKKALATWLNTQAPPHHHQLYWFYLQISFLPNYCTYEDQLKHWQKGE